MNFVNTICFSTVTLILWFNTEAFIEYSKLFKLTKIFKIDQFEEAYKNDFTLEYLPWLKSTYPCFFTKLISCPWCIGFWINILSSIFFNTIDTVCVQYLISMVLYFTITNKIL